MKHTPGQWAVRFFGNDNKDNGENMFFVEAPNLNRPKLGYGIEILQDDFGEHNGYPREQRLADAKLIAAAPELLKAALIGLKYIDNESHSEQRTEDYEFLLSVIKKATL